MEEDISDAIYGALGDFEFNEKMQEQCHKIEDLTNQLNKTLLTVSDLQNEVKDLRKSHRELEKNFSTILKTARLEIQRKDQNISQLQQKIDNTIFRRQNTFPASVQSDTLAIADPVYSNNINYEETTDQSQNRNIDLSQFHIPKETNSFVQHKNDQQNDINTCNGIENVYEHFDPKTTPHVQRHDLNDGRHHVVRECTSTQVSTLIKEEIELVDELPMTSTQSQTLDAELRLRNAFDCIHREVMESSTLDIEYKKSVLLAAKDYIYQWDCQLKCEDSVQGHFTVLPTDHTPYPETRFIDIQNDGDVATGSNTNHDTKPKCPMCNYILRNAKPSTLASHMEVHAPQNQCQRCLKPMKKSSIARHLPTCTGIPTKRHKCNQCKKTFCKMRILKQHIKTQHPVVQSMSAFPPILT